MDSVVEILLHSLQENSDVPDPLATVKASGNSSLSTRSSMPLSEQTLSNGPDVPHRLRPEPGEVDPVSSKRAPPFTAGERHQECTGILGRFAFWPSSSHRLSIYSCAAKGVFGFRGRMENGVRSVQAARMTDLEAAVTRQHARSCVDKRNLYTA